MKDKIVIDGRLPSLNTLIAGINKNRYAGNAIKKKETNKCALYFRQQCKNKYDNVFIEFHWFEKDKRRDPDNIVSAKKFILDGMQQADVIQNDGWNIKGFTDTWYVDKDNPRIEVYLNNKY